MDKDQPAEITVTITASNRSAHAQRGGNVVTPTPVKEAFEEPDPSTVVASKTCPACGVSMWCAKEGRDGEREKRKREGKGKWGRRVE